MQAGVPDALADGAPPDDPVWLRVWIMTHSDTVVSAPWKVCTCGATKFDLEYPEAFAAFRLGVLDPA